VGISVAVFATVGNVQVVKSYLLKYDDSELHACVPKEHAQLLEIADHGGLSAQTQLCFAITVIGAQLYTFHLYQTSMLKIL